MLCTVGLASAIPTPLNPNECINESSPSRSSIATAADQLSSRDLAGGLPSTETGKVHYLGLATDVNHKLCPPDGVSHYSIYW